MPGWFKTVAWVVGTLVVVAAALRLTVLDVWVVPRDPVQPFTEEMSSS